MNENEQASKIKNDTNDAPFTADTFLRTLLPVDDGWWSGSGPRQVSGWWFRGHADHRWPLVPTAFRPDDLVNDELKSLRLLIDRLPEATSQDIDRAIQSVSTALRSGDPHVLGFARMALAARVCIGDFCDRASRGGYIESLQGASQFFGLNSIVDRFHANAIYPCFTVGKKIGGEDYRELRRVVEIAQHYGIPTQLLDWTTSSMTALAFASSDWVARKWGEGGPQDLAVWALKAREEMEVPMMLFPDDEERRGESDELVLLALPANPSRDVRALRQNSRFTVADAEGARRFFYLHGRYPGADEIVRSSYNPQEEVRKYVLGAREVPRLRTLMDRLGFSIEAVKPGLESVAADCRDLWIREAHWNANS